MYEGWVTVLTPTMLHRVEVLHGEETQERAVLRGDALALSTETRLNLILAERMTSRRFLRTLLSDTLRGFFVLYVVQLGT